MIWRFRDKEILLEQTRIMGVVNITPDSFSDGGQFISPNQASEQALKLIEDGADIIDLGAESTRPGAEPVPASEQLKRLLPVIEGIRRANVDIPISIDTTLPEVAERCLDAGVDIINDVSGLKDGGKEMAEVVARTGAGIVLMHRRGNSLDMQKFTEYNDLVNDVMTELSESIYLALDHKIDRDRIVIDPGIGFSKTAEQNVELMKSIDEFFRLYFPILLGPSRKSFLGMLTGKEDPVDRDFATAGCVAYAVMKNIPIVRVHDVAGVKDVIKTVGALHTNPKVQI